MEKSYEYVDFIIYSKYFILFFFLVNMFVNTIVFSPLVLCSFLPVTLLSNERWNKKNKKWKHSLLFSNFKVDWEIFVFVISFF